MAPRDQSEGLVSRMWTVLRRNRGDTLTSNGHEKPITQHTSSREDGLNEKNEPGSGADSDATLMSAREDNLDRRRYMRVLPPWVKDGEEDISVAPQGEDPKRPPTAASAHHNHTPQPKWTRPNEHRPAGRKLDHIRDAHATIAVPLEREDLSEMMGLMSESRPPPEPQEAGHVMAPDWMQENLPNFDEPWEPKWLEKDPNRDKRFWLFSPQKRLNSWNTFLRILMRNPFVPLIFRLWLIAFVAAALGIGVYIYQRSSQLNQDVSNAAGVVMSNGNDQAVCKQQASTYLAFIVDAVAVLYILYVTYDEYFNKPLGLRRSRDKLRLLFLDLLFVIFSAANLALAFNTLADEQWACFDGNPSASNSNNALAASSTCVRDELLCRRQKGLVSVLLLAEISWVAAFSISIFRVLDRIER